MGAIALASAIIVIGISIYILIADCLERRRKRCIKLADDLRFARVQELRASLAMPPTETQQYAPPALTLYNKVRVRITEEGKTAFNDHWQIYDQPNPGLNLDQDGMTIMPLWLVMSIFGNSFSNDYAKHQTISEFMEVMDTRVDS